MTTTTTAVPAHPAETYTSTRSGLAATAEIVEIVRDLPNLGVTVEPDGEDVPKVTITFETLDAAGEAAARLGGLRLLGEPWDQYRAWTGFPPLIDGVYVVLEHDMPARSVLADRRERRHRIAVWIRAVLGVVLFVAATVPVTLATVPVYGPLPLLLFILGLVVYPDGDPGPGLVRRVASRLHRLVRRGGAR